MPVYVQQDEGSTARMIAAYQAGQEARRRREELEKQAEDRKMQKQLHQFQVKRLSLEDQLAKRRLAEEHAKLLESFSAPTAGGEGYPEVPHGGGGVLGPDSTQLPHPTVDIPGIRDESGGQLIPNIKVQPRTLEEVLAQHIRTKEQEARAGDVTVPPEFADKISLPGGTKVAPSIVTAAASVAGQQAASNRSAASDESRERAARIRANAPRREPVTRLQPKDVEINGKVVRTNYDSVTGNYYSVDTGELLKGVGTPPTAEMRNRTESRRLVATSIAPLKALSKTIITSKWGIVQKIKALGRSAEAYLANDPEYRTYQDARFALAGNLAVGQQGSRPSDADIRAIWLPLVPDSFRDTEESAEAKWRLIETMSGTTGMVGDGNPSPAATPSPAASVNPNPAAAAPFAASVPNPTASRNPAPTHWFNPATGQIEPLASGPR